MTYILILWAAIILTTIVFAIIINYRTNRAIKAMETFYNL